MKYLRLFLLLAAMVLTTSADATQYVIIKPTFWGEIRFIYVDKPHNLKRWYFDNESDTYYRFKDGFGIPHRITKPVYRTTPQ